MYSLDQLRGFVAVAEERHFGRAAARLQMTQPPLSRAIQKLERELGVVLLHRGSRAVSLTPAGAAFLDDARRILVSVETARETARRVAAGVAGSLAIGFTAMSAARVLPDVLRECEKHLPGVETTLRELVSNAQFDALTVGELDLGLVRTAPATPGIATRLIHRERLLAAIPATHELAAGTGPVPVTSLDGVDLIDYDPAGAAYFARLVASTLGDVRPRSRRRVTQVHTMLALVAAGRGVAFVPEAAVAFCAEGTIVRPLKERPDPIVELRAAWNPQTRNAALLRALETLPALRQTDA